MLDLCGVSPEKIPETYQFKSGIVGKNHIIHKRIGLLEACENPFSRIAVIFGMPIVKISKLLTRPIQSGTSKVFYFVNRGAL